MGKDVNVPGGRAARTRATRRRIVDAAAGLFVERGYGATTLEQVAERAGVAVQTVYFHFGNKRTVLKEAVDVAAVGDDEPVPLLERPPFDTLHTEPDPRRLIEISTELARVIHERVAPIMGVVRDAAVVDPDMAAQWAINQGQREVAFLVITQLLADRDALRPGLSVDEATDIVIALNSFEVYLILLGRGWTPQRWEKWLAATMIATLLDGEPVTPGSDRT